MKGQEQAGHVRMIQAIIKKRSKSESMQDFVSLLPLDSEIKCREFSSMILSMLFLEAINVHKKATSDKRLRSELESILHHIDSLKIKGILIDEKSLEKYLELEKLQLEFLSISQEKNGVPTLDSKNHYSDFFSKIKLSTLSSDKKLKEVLIPCWKKSYTLIHKIFKKGLGRGFTAKLEAFFQDVDAHNPYILMLLDHNGGEIKHKNLERLGSKKEKKKNLPAKIKK